MLKSFKELYKLDISSYTKKKPTFKRDNGKLVKTDKKFWLDYIEWATVIFLLYDNGAEKVIPEFETDINGYPAFFINGKSPFVKVKLTIDDNVYHYHYPVIDGNKVDDNPNQMTIHKAQQRAFVKCVAVNTGLGLKLWQKEEGTFDDLDHVNETKNTSKKPELFPKTKEWQDCIKALNNGYKITDIQKKYYLNDENYDRLIEESI